MVNIVERWKESG